MKGWRVLAIFWRSRWNTKRQQSFFAWISYKEFDLDLLEAVAEPVKFFHGPYLSAVAMQQ